MDYLNYPHLSTPVVLHFLHAGYAETYRQVEQQPGHFQGWGERPLGFDQAPSLVRFLSFKILFLNLNKTVTANVQGVAVLICFWLSCAIFTVSMHFKSMLKRQIKFSLNKITNIVRFIAWSFIFCCGRRLDIVYKCRVFLIRFKTMCKFVHTNNCGKRQIVKAKK